MKVLCATVKDDKKVRYWNGRQFVVGKTKAVDLTHIDNKTINKFIEKLYGALHEWDKDKYKYYVTDI